ncbi:hypothetical protein MTR67_001394, partial [Solanum verrucosum]
MDFRQKSVAVKQNNCQLIFTKQIVSYNLFLSVCDLVFHDFKSLIYLHFVRVDYLSSKMGGKVNREPRFSHSYWSH